MHKTILTIFAAVTILFMTIGSASAAWIDFDKNQVDPGKHVKMKFPHYNSLNVLVGEHILDFEQTEGAASGIYQDVASYCIEDYIAKTNPLDYDVRYITANSDDRDKEAAWIYKEYGSFYNPGTSNTQKVYNQAAIWNVFMDDDYDLGAGFVQVLNKADVLAGANQVLQDLLDFKDSESWLNYDFSGVMIATHGQSQDFITASFAYPHTPASSVPIPGAAWLLGSGLLGLVGIRSRRAA